MSLSATSRDTLKAEIVALAAGGMRPCDIAARYAGRCDRNFVNNVIRLARERGASIPAFAPAKRGPRPLHERKLAQTPAKAATPPATLDYFELRALKKLLGEDLTEIEADADAEGISVAQYVREVLRGHVRRIKA